MKQLLQNLKDGRTTVEEVPIPTPRAGMALMRTAASVVSAGTERMLVEFAEKSLLGKARLRPDLVKQALDKARREGLLNTVRSVMNRMDQPMALGYSSAGEIIALGQDMQGFKVGQRVACAGGGYAVHAEYAVVPRNLLTPIPAHVDYESAAFATLGAIAMHGFRLAEPQVGERVAIIGLGLLGLLAGQIAAAAGCTVFGIDPNFKRVALASSLGIQAVRRQNAVDSAMAITAEHGFDVILVCADTKSNNPIELAGLIARDRARVVVVGAVGLDIPRKLYYEKELSLINSRSYGPGRYDPAYEDYGQDYPIGYVRWTENRNIASVLELMASGKLKIQPLITHRFPIEQAASAYNVILGKKREPFLGVLLTYEEKQEETIKKVSFKGVSIRQSAVKLGVLGAGNFANAILLPAIKKAGGVELVGIASAGGLHAQHAGKKFRFAYAASSEKDIFNDAEINTIAIITRHDSHADLVIEALKAGKHVFVEKPLAIDNVQLSAIHKRLRAEDSPLLTVGFNRRFAPLALKLYAFLQDRKEPLYTHYRVNAAYLPMNHWTQDPKQGGGRIIGEACHFVDFITSLVGDSPVSVSAYGLPDQGKYREDNASMTFAFSDGSIGVVDYLVNGDRSYPKERVEVFCGGKVAVLDDFHSLEMVENGKKIIARTTQDKGWVNEWKAFARVIREGGEPPIPYEQLIGVTKATFAAVESLRQNQSVAIK
jgi:predicted dehydrogenase/threonine dehydrogenase-like Zn-dependent dehydrogenase